MAACLSQADQQAMEVQAQAPFLAYMDAFWVLMVVALAAAPLALSLRNIKLGAVAPMEH